jgi:hypothetical protein
MKSFIFIVFTLFFNILLWAAIPPNSDINPNYMDPGLTKALPTTGSSVQQINVQKAFRIGIESIIVTSGSVSALSANLQGSMDCVNYFTFPVSASGDARYSGSLSGSGTYFFEKTDLSVNCVQIVYSWTGAGTLTVQEFVKKHDANF